MRLKHCNGENENECKNFRDVAGWSRVLERRPPGQKNVDVVGKNNEIIVLKTRATVARVFLNNNKNNFSISDLRGLFLEKVNLNNKRKLKRFYILKK